MTDRNASCSCGQLRLTAGGDPVRISICHCLECQRRTGSIFAVQARYPRDRIRTEGRSSQWSRTGDSGGTATFHFCPVCAATVWWEPDALPNFISVAVGAFADPDFPAPHVAVYEGRQHGWSRAIDALSLERYP